MSTQVDYNDLLAYIGHTTLYMFYVLDISACTDTRHYINKKLHISNSVRPYNYTFALGPFALIIKTYFNEHNRYFNLK
jgi:hypothetical protein